MKKFKSTLLLASALAIFATSCKKNNSDQPAGEIDPIADASSLSLNPHFCIQVSPDGPMPRGATLKSVQWAPGSVIKVSLNGGSSYVRNKVIQYASEWENYANIDFQFTTNDNTAPIRVTFTQGQGSYSSLGTQARRVPSNRNTVNFGWFNDATQESDFRGTTLHEFGHVLGMIHEQQHPEVAIPWDKPKVYADLAKAPNYWDKATVDHNLFESYDISQTNFNSYDKLSIMHYSIPESWTIGTFSVGQNTVLSSNDKALVTTIYPR